MKKIILLIFLPVSIYSQTIPSWRTVDWSIAGYPDSFPNPATVLDVTTFGAVGDGITDNTSFIIDAIDSLHGGRGVIYFPTGNYKIGSTINLPDSVILRGYSYDSTKLTFDFAGANGNGFNITGSVSNVFANLVMGTNRGDFSIVVDDPSSFSPGDYAELIQDNGSWDTQPAPWATNCVGQILHLTTISGDTLFFDAALRIYYDTALLARIQKITPAVETGIECLTMTRADSGSGLCNNVFFNYAANCWIKGVESSRSIGSHIEIEASTNITITGCYVHHSFLYDGVSTHGYGISLLNHSGQCLVTNNFMRYLRHSFSLQTGANGNVISYNYTRDPTRSEIPTDAGADLSLHGHFPFANLFEGNIVQNIQIDVTWGKSGPFNTFFRNRSELYGIIESSGAGQTDSTAFVGNETTHSSFGFYLPNGSGNFEYGNNIKGTATPAGTTTLPDSSYYLSTKPSFWGVAGWPSIGYPNTLGSGSNPAMNRWLSGMNLALCDESITTNVPALENQAINLFPNPTNHSISIQGLNTRGKVSIELKDLNGRIVYSKSIAGNHDELHLDLPVSVSDGIYLLSVLSGEDFFVKKLVVCRQ